ncbi:MAG: xanthine dehydrogenase family protein subunit M [Haloglomus sp.]
MFPDEFDYYEATSVDEAIDLMQEHAGEEIELLAGGHSLIPAMKSGLSSPDVLVDVGDIDDLHGVHTEGDRLVIGAMTTYADLLDVDSAHEHAPAFTSAVRQVGDEQVRNRGTVGGNLAHADPASDLPGAALASDATIVAQGPDGEREIPIDEYFFGMYATALGPNELLTRVEIPSANGAAGAYAKKPSPSSGYAMIGVSALVETDGGVVTSARLGANGAMDHGVRLEPTEDALEGERLDEDVIEQAAAVASDDLDTDMMMEDLQASAEFREHLLTVYTERALGEVADRVGATAPAAD